MTNSETTQKTKWCFDFYYGTKSNPTDIRSGCVGADTEQGARDMIAAACWEEAQDTRAKLRIKRTRFTWPNVVS